MAEGTEPTLEELLANPASIGGISTTSFEFDPTLARPPRLVYEPQATAKGNVYVQNKSYTGSNRVSALNRFELDVNGKPLGPYDEDRDAKNELYKMDDTERRAQLTTVSKLLGGSYRPSRTGLTDSDFNAFKQVLRQANAMGRTWDVAIQYMSQMPMSAEGTGRTYRLTSPDDIKYVAQETAIQLLGRGLDPRAMQRIIKAVQAEDVRSQQSGTRAQAPNLNVAVQQQVMKQDPKEAKMQGAATIAEILDATLGGR